MTMSQIRYSIVLPLIIVIYFLGVQEFCQYGTREECQKLNESKEKCERLHFRKIIHKHTDGMTSLIFNQIRCIAYTGGFKINLYESCN